MRPSIGGRAGGGAETKKDTDSDYQGKIGSIQEIQG